MKLKVTSSDAPREPVDVETRGAVCELLGFGTIVKKVTVEFDTGKTLTYERPEE